MRNLIKLFCALCLFSSTAKAAGPGLPSTNYLWLDYWDFADTTNWTTFLNYVPISFTNLSSVPVGNGNALVIDSTNASWLNFNVTESGGSWTNLTVDTGSIQVWVNPNWSGTNQGGAGPGAWSRVIEAGSYNSNSPAGWWSLYTDNTGCNLYFSAQTNAATTNYCAVPIAWTTGQWHSLALTYSSTNTALYIDGALATNGPGMTIWPDTTVLANGFWIGSDSNGLSQFHGALSQLTTYSTVLDSNSVYANYILGGLFYGAGVFNGTNLVSAPSTPDFLYSFNAITGPGYLQSNGGFTSGCVTNSNVWITNVSALLTNGTMALSFGIAGGSNGVPYDVFATTALTNRYGTNVQWAWMGQGFQCQNYRIPGLPTNSPCFLILGQPRDDDGDSLTTAYELLVSKTNPYSPDTYGGIPDAWFALHGYGSKLLSGFPSLDPDGDGLLNSQEYLYGTDPRVPEGFSIWVASPAGAAGIP